MPLGQTLVITACGPNPPYPGFSIVNQAAAGTCGSGTYQQIGQAYVLYPSSKAAIEAVTQPFDYAMGTQFWALGFTTVLGLHVASHMIGVVLNFLKRA